jgi:hypothetical protein
MTRSRTLVSDAADVSRGRGAASGRSLGRRTGARAVNIALRVAIGLSLLVILVATTAHLYSNLR